MRHKGSLNEKTKAWNKLGLFITDTGAKKAMNIIDKLEGEEYLNAYYKLLSFFKPKLQSTSLTSDEGITINIVENGD